MSMPKFDANPGEARAYRQALGRFATGVALVAAKDEAGEARAITINSFASISLDPPIVSWAIDEASDRYHLFTNAREFSVNILAADQQALAERFTRHVEAVIPQDILEMVAGWACIRGALSRLRCRTRFMERVGDHTVVFGSVLGFDDNGPGEALGYLHGGYVRLRRE